MAGRLHADADVLRTLARLRQALTQPLNALPGVLHGQVPEDGLAVFVQQRGAMTSFCHIDTEGPHSASSLA